MDTAISSQFDMVFMMVTLLFGVLSLIVAIGSKKDRVPLIGVAILMFLASGRTICNYGVFEISFNGHHYEGFLFLVLIIIASALIIIGGFSVLRRKFSSIRKDKNADLTSEHPVRIKRVGNTSENPAKVE